MALTKTCVPYDSGKIRVEDENGALYVVYQGDDLEGTVSFDPAEVTIDGKEQNVFTFYCYTTLWSEYIEPIFDDETEKTQERIMYVGQKDEIDRIYYGEFDSTDPLSAEYGLCIDACRPGNGDYLGEIIPRDNLQRKIQQEKSTQINKDIRSVHGITVGCPRFIF